MFLSLMTSALARLFARPDTLEADCIDHPLLQGMSLRELADLPFPRPPAPELQADPPQPAVLAPVEPTPPSPEALPHAA